MELFSKRYLCFIAFAFILSSLFCCFISGVAKIVIAFLAFVGVAVATVLFMKKKLTSFHTLFTFVLCIGVFISSLSSYFFITRAEQEANSVLGENAVLVRILTPEDENEYNVRVLRVGDTEVSIKGELYIDADEKFEYGDELIVRAMVDRATDFMDRSKLLRVTADITDVGFYLDRPESKNYFSFDGIKALCSSMRDGFGDFVDGAFGEDGAIVKGLLVNDKRDIDAETQLSFKRSGTSHIMAVSGLHIALIMGAIDLLLRKLLVRKEIRIALISVFAIFFLGLTAFAASAVRSVLMLYAVYVAFLFFEENDPITSLFVAIAIIILFTPYSVYDVGMWMSFLATLGILLVYSYFESLMPYPKNKNKALKYTLRFLVKCVKAIMMTVIANFFLLPIMWLFFGELSISTVPCNLALGPIVTLLLPLCAVATLLSRIPYLGDALVFLTKKIIDLFLAVIEFFSEIRFGVVSLSHVFAGVLITLFSAVMIVLLVIKLKRKSWIFVPMLAFAVAFASCFSVFCANAEPEIRYLKDGKSELLFVNWGVECSVVDLSGNSVYDGIKVVNNMSNYATEINAYVVTNPSSTDAVALTKVMENTIIRKIYLPISFDYEQSSAFKNVLISAEICDIEIAFYGEGDTVEICNGVSFSDMKGDRLAVFSNNASIGFFDEKVFYTYDGVNREIPKLYDVTVDLPFS